MNEEVGPPSEYANTGPVSPGGTTVENGIETVTVEKSRLFPWGKVLTILAVFFAVRALLSNRRG